MGFVQLVFPANPYKKPLWKKFNNLAVMLVLLPLPL